MLTMILVVTLSVNGATNAVNANSVIQKIVVVTANVLNVRKLANQQSQKVGNAVLDQSLIVTGESGDFLNLSDMSESQTDLLLSKMSAGSKFAIFCAKGEKWQQLYY